MGKIKLIASDLDGTLLLNEARQCNAELFSIIEALVDKGVYFLPASGRQYPNMRRLFAPVDEKLMYLCENGALVMHLNRPIVKNVFEDGLALDICHAVYEHPACEVLISGERTSYLIPKDRNFISYMRDFVGNNVAIVDAPERIEEPIIKIAYYAKPQLCDQAAADFKALFGERCLMFTSGNVWVDFAPLGTSKGSALKSIGELLGILPEEMVAFGDNENDRTMLEFVGHPYIMEHCNPSLLDIEAKRCSKVEDALREILETL